MLRDGVSLPSHFRMCLHGHDSNHHWRASLQDVKSARSFRTTNKGKQEKLCKSNCVFYVSWESMSLESRAFKGECLLQTSTNLQVWIWTLISRMRNTLQRLKTETIRTCKRQGRNSSVVQVMPAVQFINHLCSFWFAKPTHIINVLQE